MNLVATRNDHLIAQLAALAIMIHVLESALPSPIPGVKPGLANVVTIVTLCAFGWRTAAWVSLLRVIIGSLVVGSFMSPGFALALSGAIASLIALRLALLFPGLSPLGLSAIAAQAHMAGQFSAAYFLFLPHPALLKLLPILLSAALLFGVLTGLLAQAVVERVPRTVAA